jgi:acetyl esterase/lipase
MRLQRASDRVAVTEDIAYVADDEPKHRLDLYVPRATNGARFPVVLFVHGGFWRGQDRRYFQAFSGIYGNFGVALAKRGIGVAVMSYRLSPSVGIADQLADVLAALRWTQGNVQPLGGDPRVVLAGYSAGGHLVTLLGLDPRHMVSAGMDPKTVRGYVSLSGILDVPAMAKGQDAEFNRDVSFRLFGSTPEEQARLSPSSYVRADAPPLLAFAAQRDYPFVVSGGREVAARLQAAGARATFVEVPGIDHSDMILDIDGDHDQVTDTIAAFVHDVAKQP